MARRRLPAVLPSSRRPPAVKHATLELFADAEVRTADVGLGIGVTSAPAEARHVSQTGKRWPTVSSLLC